MGPLEPLANALFPNAADVGEKIGSAVGRAVGSGKSPIEAVKTAGKEAVKDVTFDYAVYGIAVLLVVFGLVGLMGQGAMNIAVQSAKSAV